MSTDKEKLDQLLKKVDDIVTVLAQISTDLRSVSASLKSLAVGQITQPQPTSQTPTTPTAPTPAPTSKQRSVDDIRMSFPEELETRLGFEDKGDYIIIKPKQFLGSENFAKIASAVR